MSSLVVMLKKRGTHHTIASERKRKRCRKRKSLTLHKRGVVSFIHRLNKSLFMCVPLFCLRFLTPKFTIFLIIPTLSNLERYLLSLGLNFRPTSRVVSVNNLNHQIDDFIRSVRIKHFFRDNNSVNTSQYRKLFVKINQNASLQGVLLGLSFLYLLSDQNYVLYIIIIIIIL